MKPGRWPADSIASRIPPGRVFGEWPREPRATGVAVVVAGIGFLTYETPSEITLGALKNRSKCDPEVRKISPKTTIIVKRTLPHARLASKTLLERAWNDFGEIWGPLWPPPGRI